MDSKLKTLLAKDAPTKQDVAQAKQLAKGRMKPQLLAMEARHMMDLAETAAGAEELAEAARV